MHSADKIENAWKHMFHTVELIRNFHNRTTPYGPKIDITMSQIRVMTCIYFSPQGKVKVKEIAGELGITSGAVSQIVDGLVKIGILERKTDETDRRAVEVSLSEKGTEARIAIDSSFTELMGRLFQNVTERELDVFRTVFAKIGAELDMEKKSFTEKKE